MTQQNNPELDSWVEECERYRALWIDAEQRRCLMAEDLSELKQTLAAVTAQRDSLILQAENA